MQIITSGTIYPDHWTLHVLSNTFELWRAHEDRRQVTKDTIMPHNSPLTDQLCWRALARPPRDYGCSLPTKRKMKALSPRRVDFLALESFVHHSYSSLDRQDLCSRSLGLNCQLPSQAWPVALCRFIYRPPSQSPTSQFLKSITFLNQSLHLLQQLTIPHIPTTMPTNEHYCEARAWQLLIHV